MFQYIKVDETKFWSQNFREKHGVTKMIATYAFNNQERVHCCELTPSYFMRYLGSGPEMDRFMEEDEREVFHEEMMEAELYNGDNDCYMHCHHVKNMDPKDVVQDCETLDDVVEEFCSNPW